jgi:hypothetical protein
LCCDVIEVDDETAATSLSIGSFSIKDLIFATILGNRRSISDEETELDDVVDVVAVETGGMMDCGCAAAAVASAFLSRLPFVFGGI